MGFTGSLIYLFRVLDNMFLTAIRHKVNNVESCVVAINFALLGFMEFR